MSVVGPFWVVAATLIASGVVKLASPDAVAGALGRLHLPHHRVAGQALGLVEIAIGAVAIAFGAPTGAAVLAGWYLLLAAAASMLLYRGAPSCGCFGQDSAPPSWLHLALDLVAAGIAVTAIAMGTPSAGDVLDDLGWLSVVFLPFVGIGVAAFIAAFDLLPRVLAEASRTRVAEFGIRR